MARDLKRVFDEYTVAAARTGDRTALARLVRHWQPRLLAHAYRLTQDFELAREVTQDAWIDIMRGLVRLKDSAAFPAWAFRIVTRRAADAIRRAQRARRTRSALADEPQEPVAPASGENGGLHRAVDDLPPPQRAAVLLYYIEGFSTAEIATVLEVPAGTVKTRLMHARRKLRAALEGEDDG